MKTLRIKLFFSVWFFVATQLHAQTNKIVFATHWLPQAQFSGFYVAQDQGFYRDAGLDVDIIHPSASVNATKYLAEGKADVITLFLISALDAKSKGIDLVNTAQFSQHSALLFVTKKSSGIETLEDLNGKKIGIWRSGFEEVPKALLNEYKIQVEWVPILSSVNLFLLDGIDALTVMWYNEYNQIYLSGINRDELNTFFMSDYGYDIPEDGLYVLKKTAETKQEELSAFVEASLKGWEYAARNKEYTINLVVEIMRKANIPSNIAHQRWMLEKVLELQGYRDKVTYPTQLSPNDFEHAKKILQSTKNVDLQIDYDDFFQPMMPGISQKP